MLPWRDSLVCRAALFLTAVVAWICTHSYVLAAQSCPTLCNPTEYSSPGSSVHGILQARILEWVAIPLSRDLPHPPTPAPPPGIELMSPPLQADFLPSESPGKPKNTGVGSLSLLQRNFLTQEWNQGLLHCRQILYQPSYQGSLLDICNI